MPEDNLTLRATGLTRYYGPRRAVHRINLELHKGEVLGLLGPNGAGKSTTMQMLTGNLAPTEGAIEVCGIDLIDAPRRAKARIGYLPETPPLYRELSVDEYLRFVARLHRIRPAHLARMVTSARERCGLADMGRRVIGTLSKGYRQRVGIAQAIVHNPDVVILDEPTVGLDPIQIREIRALIRELAGEHSVILSTHILPEVESVCDRVLILHQGEFVFEDTIEGLRNTRRGNMLTVGLRRPPAASRLSALPGVISVDRDLEPLFRIRYAPDQDPTETLVAQAVNDDWGLYLLEPSRTTLEDVFVHLTQQEEA